MAPRTKQYVLFFINSHWHKMVKDEEETPLIEIVKVQININGISYHHRLGFAQRRICHV